MSIVTTVFEQTLNRNHFAIKPGLYSIYDAID